jgi:peptide/nickel transport system permease protein
MKDAIRGRSPWKLAFERLSRDRWATAAAACIVFIILVAILAPLIAAAVQHSPESQFRETGLSPSGIPVGPSRVFLFGTDGLGRDILVRIVYGARVSLVVGVLASGLAVLVGALVGIAAGWFGGVIDTILSGLSAPLSLVSANTAALLMIPFHVIVHIPVSSVSGHAVLTMPVLVPLSDILGISRQVTVMAYQTGAGLTELVTPTNGALMAVLLAAGVSFARWIRFAIVGVLLVLPIGVAAMMALR